MKTGPMIRTIELRDRNGRVTGTKDVVTYQGLLSRAHDEGLKRVTTELIQTPTDSNDRTAIAKASVETGKGIFEAFGDANPGNVNPFIVPHLIRMAETRAKARALRDAVNVGTLSAEELLGDDGPAVETTAPMPARVPSNDQRSLRDNDDAESPSRRQLPGSLGEFVPMTENQRRYLFRLLGNLGFHGDAATEAIKTRFAIPSLDSVSKTDAIHMIAQLVDETGSAAPASQS